LTAHDTVAKFKAYQIKQAPVRAQRKAREAFSKSIRHLPKEARDQAKKKKRLEDRLKKIQDELSTFNENME
jgi:hypothetical protein